MSVFPRVQIYNEYDDKPFPTHVKIDGKLIKGVRGVSYHYAVGGIQKVTLELVSLMDSGIDIYNPELIIKFHPQTIQEAMQVLGIDGEHRDGDDTPVYMIDDGK